MAESVNTQIADAILEQHLRVARVGTSTRQAALRLLALLEDDLAQAITLADLSAPALLRARQLILQQLLGEEIRPLVQTRYETMAETTGTAATRLAVFEAQNTVAMINAVVGTEMLKEEVAASTIRRQVRETLLPSVATRQDLSATASTWWTRQAASLEQRVFDQINVGIVQGEDIGQLVRRLRGTRAQGYTDGVMEISRRDATRLVRTQFNSVANTAQLAVYDANPESIRALKHLSTLDARVSVVCLSRHGLQYTVPEHKGIGHSIPFNGGPPYHWNALAAGTRIITDDGWCPIEEVRVGTEVLTGKGRWRRVTETMGKLCETATIHRIETTTGRQLCVTGDHPILVFFHGWMPAEKLEVGQYCVGYEARQGTGDALFLDAPIVQHTEIPYDGLVYNLAVADDETYVAEGLVVHNCRSIMTPVVAGAGPSIIETFEQFLRRRGEAFQDEVLGPGRARLFREQQLSTRDLLDAATGRPLTLEELGA